ncbi:MAG TPA: hypothetical protein VJO52_09640 [Gemmatimonadaceae bacterium]|nr:hypothetical protein [Gemmatimonadaceae bacterium]
MRIGDELAVSRFENKNKNTCGCDLASAAERSEVIRGAFRLTFET